MERSDLLVEGVAVRDVLEVDLDPPLVAVHDRE
jgi:hypothetical protein